MKKVLTAILLIVCGAAASAQVDTVGRAGTPADTNYYYDTVEYFAPKRNPIYYFGSPFCDHFFELRCILGGDDIGLGALYTYLPEVWGFNVSASMMDVKYFMTESFRLMKGNIFRYLYMLLSFIGYYALVLMSFGVAIIWVAPYQYMTMVQFYEDLRK